MEEKLKLGSTNFHIKTQPVQCRKIPNLLQYNPFPQQAPNLHPSLMKIASLMTKIKLSSEFNPKQFKIISSLSPEEWLKGQKYLLTKMTEDSKIHEKFFNMFYSNHVTLSNWHTVAVRNKAEIEKYLFKEIFAQKRKQKVCLQENFNNERLKETMNENDDENSTDKDVFRPIGQTGNANRNSTLTSSSSRFQQIQSQNASFMKPTLPIPLRKPLSANKQRQQVMGVFFNNVIELNQIKHKRKPLNLKLYKLKKRQSIDEHELYMRTFDACNGRKYIFYDYEKHMKGLKERNGYNRYLRMENSCEMQNRTCGEFSSSKLNRFEEFETFKSSAAKQKCSLLPVNMVLNEQELNNYNGLKKVVNQNNSSKIVFVNHQGKPITYYIKQNTKQKTIASKDTKRLTRNFKGKHDISKDLIANSEFTESKSNNRMSEHNMTRCSKSGKKSLNCLDMKVANSKTLR